MDLLRKYGGTLFVILVIVTLILICVVAGIRASGRDLPWWGRADKIEGILSGENTSSDQSMGIAQSTGLETPTGTSFENLDEMSPEGATGTTDVTSPGATS